MNSKIVFFFMIMCCCSVTLFAQTNTGKKQTSTNPVFDGWYADPEGVVFGDKYWIYPTYSAPFEQQLYMDAFSSPDLVHWRKHPKVLSVENISWLRNALWAPAVIEANGKYYFYFGANNIYHESEVGGIGVAVADRPEGPFKDALGKPLIGKIVNGAQPIDQFVFKDDDGQYYMYYGKYYFMWSEGDWTGPDYCVAYAIADSPFGPFKRVGKILEQDTKIANGAGHHSIIKGPGKDEWYIVYHRRPLGETDGNYRITCIDRMYFNTNGTIKPVKMTSGGIKARPLR